MFRDIIDEEIKSMFKNQKTIVQIKITKEKKYMLSS